MKKLILIVFLCLVLSAFIVACDNSDKNSNDAKTENTAADTPTTEEPTTEAPITEELLPRELSMDDLKDCEIIIALWSYLDRFHSSINMSDPGVERKINRIKNGDSQALYVSFNPSDYYYVCGYYNPEHENGESDNNNYCCVSKYTWVKFSSKEDITEYYNNTEFAAAFQINSAEFVKDIVTEDAAVPEFEHYFMYFPQFVEGVNVAGALDCDVSFLYCKSVDYENDYYLIDSVDSRVHHLSTFPCFEFDEKKYVAQEIRVGNMERDLEAEFGEYYDVLMGVMNPNVYSKIINDKTHYYGLFDIDEFTDKVLK